MAKFYGPIGYAQQVEVRPGVWEEQIIEKHYRGDVLRNTRRLQSTDKINDDVNISNEISIVADPFANGNFHSIRYVKIFDAKWKVTNVDVQNPRLILTLGGLYND